MLIGERINPTGKKKLQAELREGSLNMVRQMALDQEENGAAILDVNMGMNGIDEKEMMLKAISKVTMVSSLPLCIDTSYVEVMEAALRVYPGRALINSISLEKEKIEVIMVREKDEELGKSKVEDLKYRVKIMNEVSPVLAVSIHQNSYHEENVFGAQVFYYQTSTEGEKAAGIIQDALQKIEDQVPMSDEIHNILNFVRESKGIVK